MKTMYHCQNFAGKKMTMPGALLALWLVFIFCSGCSKVENQAEGTQAEGNSIEDVLTLIKKNSLRDGVHYVSEVQIKDVNNTIEMWVMGERIKSAIINNNKATVVISDGTYMTTYVSDEKCGVRMKLDADNAHKEFFNPGEDLSADSISVVRRETFRDKPCVVVKAKKAFDGTECLLWIDESDGFVKRMESISENGEPMVVVNRDVKFGPVDDAVFTVPSEIYIEELM